MRQQRSGWAMKPGHGSPGRTAFGILTIHPDPRCDFIALGMIADIALILSIVGNVISVSRWLYRRHARLTLGPSSEIREAIHSIRERFDDLIALGGSDTGYFTDVANRGQGQRIQDLLDRTTDDELKRLLSEISQCWNRCFAKAPKPTGDAVKYLTGKDAADAFNAKRAGVAAEAQAGSRASADALRRLNLLERRISGLGD